MSATVYSPEGRELAVTATRARGWLPVDDADELADATVICPAVVNVAGGGQYHALIVEATDHRRWAVYWCRYLHAFRALEVTP